MIPNATGGDGTDIGAFESFAPFAVSRKTHGAAVFDIALPLTGAAGIECRTGGTNGSHQLIMTFPSAVSLTSASVTTGTGSVNSFTVNGGQVTVNLTGVSNAPENRHHTFRSQRWNEYKQREHSDRRAPW